MATAPNNTIRVPARDGHCATVFRFRTGGGPTNAPLSSALPFFSHGLVFEVELRNDRPFVNLPASRRIWRTRELPWGSGGPATQRLARAVVLTLRPDWAESFWSRAFVRLIATDFARRFLETAPATGGHVPMQAIRQWMADLRIGLPSAAASLRSVR